MLQQSKIPVGSSFETGFWSWKNLIVSLSFMMHDIHMCFPFIPYLPVSYMMHKASDTINVSSFPMATSPHLGGHNPKPSFSFYISTMSINDVLLISGKSFKKKSKIFQNMTKKHQKATRKNRSWLKPRKIQVWKGNKWRFGIFLGFTRKKTSSHPRRLSDVFLQHLNVCAVASRRQLQFRRSDVLAAVCVPVDARSRSILRLMSPVTWCPSPAGVPSCLQFSGSSLGHGKGFLRRNGGFHYFTPNLWPFDLDFSRPVLSTPVDLGVTYGNLLSDKGTDNLIELLQGLIFSFMWYSCAFPHSLHKMA